ncbi:MAG: inositol monophosphatase [Dictyoglomus sp. NZ13-RE01]|nr:MAG: inositol monophosphatase [Dictyoglomus sp. NZ13-RE01]
MREEIKVIEKIVKEAGKILLNYFYEEKEVRFKSTSNPVTKIDKLSEEKLIEGLEKYFPGYTILTEESGFIDKGSDYKWIIDPLDGTINYIHNFPFFSISIALIKKDEIILGVVYDPLRDEFFSAYRKEGAHLNFEKIYVSSVDKISNALLAFGLPYHLTLDDENFQPFIDFSKRCQSIRRAGSSALELAYIASGRLDGYWCKELNLWDIAGGIILVEEAGGKVTDYQGKKIIQEKTSIIATNGLIHEEVRNIINRVRL